MKIIYEKEELEMDKVKGKKGTKDVYRNWIRVNIYIYIYIFDAASINDIGALCL